MKKGREGRRRVERVEGWRGVEMGGERLRRLERGWEGWRR